MALSKIETQALDVGQIGGRRNLIINGAMQVAQRGASFSNIASDTYVTDRWYVPHSSVTPDISQESVTVGGETGLPTQLTTYARVDANVSGASNLGVVTRLEDVRNYTGTHILSFYAKGTNPTGGVFGCRFIQRFSVGGSSQVITDATDTFAVTSTWQRFEVPIDLPSVAGKTIPTPSSSYVQIQITQPNSDVGTGTWTLDITGVQLEVGTVATPFEHRSYGEELALCQRYTWVIKSSSAYSLFGPVSVHDASTANAIILFPQTMRATPTLGQSGSFSIYSGDGGDGATVGGIDGNTKSPYGVVLNLSGSGFTDNSAGFLRGNNDTSASISFFAEL